MYLVIFQLTYHLYLNHHQLFLVFLNFLNFYSCKEVTIEDSYFNNIYADAVDSDFSNISISNTIFEKIEIDIAIDCMCHTGKSRFQLFVKKIAPIQINFLGYPGTSGSKFVDYIVADKVIIPEQNQKYFTEKIIYLPDTYQANEDKKKPLSDQALSESLKEKGYNVARRTVAKYREQLDLPVARLRKSI